MVPLTEAQQALAAKRLHLDWTENLLRARIRFYPRFEEELRTEALLSLIYAAQTFDESRHAEFTTYLTYCVKRGFRTAMRRAHRPHRYGPRMESLPPHHDPIDHRRRDEPFAGELTDLLLDSLPHYQADLLVRIVCDGDTAAETGRYYKLCTQTILNHMNQALQTLRCHPTLAKAV